MFLPMMKRIESVIEPASERKQAQAEHKAQQTARSVALVRGNLAFGRRASMVRESVFDRSARRG